MPLITTKKHAMNFKRATLGVQGRERKGKEEIT